MSAIAGCWSRRGEASAKHACRMMLEAQRAYDRDDLAMAERGAFAAGRCLHRSLEEDRFDRQPLGGEDSLLLVADLRIDNRAELLAALGAPDRADASDAELLLQAWRRWREGLLDRVLGDFAFAVWDEAEQRLFLARDPLGERPLHYHDGDGFFAFASMPGALAALPEVGRQVDEQRLAAFVADLPPRGSDSFFAGVKRIEPGHWLEATPRGVRTMRYWDPRGSSLRLPRAQDYGEALREQIDRAVRARLRRASGLVGAQLSAGLDSGAVAAAAATALAERGERLLAFTAAPRAGYEGDVPAGRFADESAAAAATAALHRNIDHVVIRPEGESPLALIERSHQLAGQPVGHVCNNVWWSVINRAARDRGVTVMLTGEAGNLTISAGGGLGALADLARLGAWRRWRREARALRQHGFGPLNLLNATIGPWLPRRAYRLLRAALKGGPEAVTSDVEFVAGRWKRDMARRERLEGWDMHPPRDGRDRRWAVMQEIDPGPFRKASLAAWGLEERDPTADRRLVEFCFSLPVEALLTNGVRRPALRAALEGRIAPQALAPGPRGYQAADWHEQLSGEEVRAFARALREEVPDAVVDFDAIDAAAAAWPQGGWHERPVLYRYQTRLLRALAAADFTRSVLKGG